MLHDSRGDIAVTVDYGQKYPLIEAVVKVVDPPVPGLQGVVDMQGTQGRAFELALIQPRIELQVLQRLLETVVIGLMLGLDRAAGQQQAQ
ncbi:hypothetical protein D3C71_1691360 [compost metagenome]